MIHQYKRTQPIFGALEWNAHRPEESLEVLVNWTGFIQCYIDMRPRDDGSRGILVCPGLPGRNTAYDGDFILRDDLHKMRIIAKEDFLREHDRIPD